jgi:hypothetical protein
MEDGKMLEKVDNPKDLTTAEAVFEAFRLSGPGKKLKVKEISSICGKPVTSVGNIAWIMSEAGILTSGKSDTKAKNYWAMGDVIEKGRDFFVGEYRKQVSAIKRDQTAKKKSKKTEAKQKAKPKDIVVPLEDNRSKCADNIRVNIERLNNNLETAHLLGLKVEIDVFEAENGRNRLESKTYLEY